MKRISWILLSVVLVVGFVYWVGLGRSSAEAVLPRVGLPAKHPLRAEDAGRSSSRSVPSNEPQALARREPTRASIGQGEHAGLASDSSLERVAITVVRLDEATVTPVSGALVSWDHEGEDGSTEAYPSQSTDENGRLDVLVPPGTLHAEAFTDHGASERKSLVVKSGEEVSMTLLLEPSTVVTGVVRDARTGAPVSGATVTLGVGSPTVSAVSGIDGAYSLKRFPMDTVYRPLKVSADGFGVEQVQIRAPVGLAWEVQRVGLGSQSKPATITTSSDHFPVRADFELTRAVSYVGTVVDPTGKPVEGARVTLLGYYTILAGAAAPDSQRGLSGLDGSFRIGGLRSDIRHWLQIEAPGWGQEQIAPQPWAGENDRDYGVVPLDVEVQVSLVVQDTWGELAQGLTLNLRKRNAVALPLGPSPGERFSRQSTFTPRVASRTAVTDIDGVAAFKGLSPGQYRVTVAWNGSPPAPYLLREEMRLSAAGSEEIRYLQLPATTVTVAGEVRDPDGTPVPAEVRVWSRAVELGRLVADEAGRFRISGLLPGTPLRVGVRWQEPGGGLLESEVVTTSDVDSLFVELQDTENSADGV